MIGDILRVKGRLTMSKQVLHTKFGTAKTSSTRDYYAISSGKEGNYKKLLHRLIWEDFYGMAIPEGYIIHHKNGNKTDNCILNLQLMRSTDHKKLHMGGENHPFYGVSLSEDTKQKISKTTGTTGIHRVSKNKDKRHTQGFKWIYQYYKDGKRHGIFSVDLCKLKQKVLEKGLPWEIVDKEKSKKSFIENEKNRELNSQ